MLLASPLAIVAYYMLASVLTSYIAVRLIRTWGLVGRIANTFSRKERLPISLPGASTPSTSPASTNRVHTNYVEWMAKLLAQLKIPVPKIPLATPLRIELPISNEDETVLLEEARAQAEQPKLPPPLVDLEDSGSPMLGIFSATSNVSACPTPEPPPYRHLSSPSPVPWRPGTTPPVSATSRFSTLSPRLPTTPPPTFIPLSPYASPTQMLKGRHRETYEMGTFSQPLIQFSPVTSPLPRALFPHDLARTPSPVQHDPRFLSTSPTPLSRSRRAMSFGGATAMELPSLEARIGGPQWGPGRSNSLVDLERSGYDDMQPMQYVAPTPTRPIFFGVPGQGVPSQQDTQVTTMPQPFADLSHQVSRPLTSHERPMKPLRQDGEFGLFDNPFTADSPQPLRSIETPSILLDGDWISNVEEAISPSSLTCTPVVVNYSDTIPFVDQSSESSTKCGLEEQMSPSLPEPTLSTLDAPDTPPVSHVWVLDNVGNLADSGDIPDPEDLPLPFGWELIQRFPDPELLELPHISNSSPDAWVLVLLCSFIVAGQGILEEDPLSLEIEGAVEELGDLEILSTAPPSPTAMKPSSDSEMEMALVTPLPEGDEGLIVPEVNRSIVTSGPTWNGTPTLTTKLLAEEQSYREIATADKSPEPVASQGSTQSDKDKGLGPTLTSGASPPIVPPSSARPSKPRQRALSSGGFTATIIETWRRGRTSPLDVALAMQMRPGLGAGADPAFMVRFLMAAWGWFIIVVNGGID